MTIFCNLIIQNKLTMHKIIWLVQIWFTKSQKTDCSCCKSQNSPKLPWRLKNKLETTPPHPHLFHQRLFDVMDDQKVEIIQSTSTKSPVTVFASASTCQKGNVCAHWRACERVHRVCVWVCKWARKRAKENILEGKHSWKNNEKVEQQENNFLHCCFLSSSSCSIFVVFEFADLEVDVVILSVLWNCLSSAQFS